MSLANSRPKTDKCGIRRKNGTTCDLPAGWGTTHNGTGPCKLHGGMLPTVASKAKRDLIEFRATLALAQLGQAPSQDPQQALLDLVSQSAALVAFYGEQVRILAEKEQPNLPAFTAGRLWAGGSDYEKGSGLFGPQIDVDKDGVEHVVGEDLRGMVKLWNEERDRLAKYAKSALDAGIEKRRIEMAEQHGEMIVVVVNNVLVKLGMSSETLAAARTMIAEEFRQIGSGDGT